MTEHELRRQPWYTASNDPNDRSGPWEDSIEEELVSCRVVSNVFLPASKCCCQNDHSSAAVSLSSRSDVKKAVEALVGELNYKVKFRDKAEIASIEDAEARRAVLTNTLRLLEASKRPIKNGAFDLGISGNLIGNICKPLADIRMAIEAELQVVNRYIKPIKGCRMVRRGHRFFTGKSPR